METRPASDPNLHRLNSNSSCKSDDSRLALANFNRGGVVSQCLLLSALVFALASCGERKDDSSSESVNSFSSRSSHSRNGIFNTGCQSMSEILSSPTGLCLQKHTSSSGSSAPTPPPATRTANIGEFNEFEPNDSPVSATPVAFPSRLGVDVVGIEISGSVLDASDYSDYFVLSPLVSKNYLIYLCATTCLEHPTDSKVAIRVFDESLNLVSGNPLAGESTKFVAADLEAGLTYYVQIVAIGTGSLGYPYRLVIIE